MRVSSAAQDCRAECSGNIAGKLAASSRSSREIRAVQDSIAIENMSVLWEKKRINAKRCARYKVAERCSVRNPIKKVVEAADRCNKQRTSV